MIKNIIDKILVNIFLKDHKTLGPGLLENYESLRSLRLPGDPGGKKNSW